METIVPLLKLSGFLFVLLLIGKGIGAVVRNIKDQLR